MKYAAGGKEVSSIPFTHTSPWNHASMLDCASTTAPIFHSVSSVTPFYPADLLRPSFTASSLFCATVALFLYPQTQESPIFVRSRCLANPMLAGGSLLSKVCNYVLAFYEMLNEMQNEILVRYWREKVKTGIRRTKYSPY